MKGTTDGSRELENARDRIDGRKVLLGWVSAYANFAFITEY